MSDDDKKRKLPVVTVNKLPSKVEDYQVPLPRQQGVVASTITGFQARASTKSIDRITENINARTRSVEAGIGLMRTLGRAQDINNILCEDQAQRDEDRAATAHARNEADRRRQRDIDMRDKDDEIARLRKEVELAQARNDAIYHARRAAATDATKDMFIESARHKVGTETVMREIKYLTVQQAIAKRRAERTSSSGGPQDPELVKLLDEEIANAAKSGEPAVVMQRLQDLKQHATTSEVLLVAVRNAIAEATARGDPTELTLRLSDIYGGFTDP